MISNNIKHVLKELFTYVPEKKHEFYLPNQAEANNCGYMTSDSESLNTSISENTKKATQIKNVFESLEVNIEYVKSKYNLLINSDIILRQFTINARNKQYAAFLLYIDGMVDSQIMNDFILEPLMLRNNNNIYDGNQSKVISEAKTNNITVRKVKKFDITEYLVNCLIPQNNVKTSKEFSALFSGINSGNCALFVDTLDIAFDIEVKGFKQRSIGIPHNEIIIKGPQEAFVENIRTNTSMIRRIINNEDLVVESVDVGNITKTKCAICYIDNLTNTDLISEVRFRLNNLQIDSLLSSGELEQLISESNDIGIPEILSTERPDKVTKHLLQGRVAILVNGTPYALIVPGILLDFLSSSEDTNLKPKFGNFLKILRAFAAFITLLLPGIYVAITSFHQEILPTELLFSIISARENVPFPVIFEILLMEICFELIREAGLRVPSPIGPTIGIVGALVLGQAAVSATIVSPILIIIVALTGISSFAIPDFSFGFHLRYYRFLFIFLGYMAGFLGISLGLIVYISILGGMKSFGVNFATPLAPSIDSKANGFLVSPIWKQEYREPYASPKKSKKQDKISMKWKFENKE